MVCCYKRADGVGQLVFASSGLLQFAGEIEQRRFENIDARVVPNGLIGLEPAFAAQLIKPNCGWFLYQPLQTELVVEKIQSALGDILAWSDGDYPGKIAFIITMNHALISF